MKLENSFEVAAPVERVWETLIDLEQVAPCLPGAAITGRDEDGTYHGTFQVKLGPTTASYRGTIRIEHADEGARTATLAARGTDKRGQGGASATIVNTLHATPEGGTRVEAATDFTITGRLASFGRGGMIKDISNRLLGEFSSCLQQRLTAEPEPAAAATAEERANGAPSAGEPAAPPARPEPTAPAGAIPPPPPPPAAPLQAHSLVLGVLRDRAKALAPYARQRVETLLPVLRQAAGSLVERIRARRSR